MAYTLDADRDDPISNFILDAFLFLFHGHTPIKLFFNFITSLYRVNWALFIFRIIRDA